MDAATILARIRDLVTADPFGLVETPEPFSFDRVPAHLDADSVRIEMTSAEVAGGFAFSEQRTDDVDVWVATTVDLSETRASYARLLTLANSLTSAIVRDGCGAGDFAVPDGGRRVEIAQPEGAAVQVLRLTVPVDYMTDL